MISDLILIAKKFSVPSGYGRRDGVRDFFAQYHDGVYIATDAGAPAGWEGYAVWFGGAGERYAERFMEFIRDGYIVERFLRARVGGLLVFTFRCRLKMRRFGTLGKPHGKPDALNFYMPNGGTISLNKTGSPTVVELEYSLDEGATWTVWPEDGSGNRSLTLTAGQRMYVRNTSETNTGFSNYTDKYYKFAFTDVVYTDGNVGSLMCKYSNNAVATYGCFISLFDGCSTMVTPPIIPFTQSNIICFYRMFFGCTNMIRIPTLHFETVSIYACSSMFRECRSIVETGDLPFIIVYNSGCENMFSGDINLRVVKTKMESYGSNGIVNWLYHVASTGDFYCPAELTIPVGSSGIPSGWTRHDI